MNKASDARETESAGYANPAGGVTIASMHCENDIHLDPLDPTGLVGAHDAEAEAVLDRIGPLDGRRLLEVGCGDGWHLVGAADRGAEAWGVDPSTALLWLARSQLAGADLRLGSADELPFDTGSFDVVCRFDCSDDHAEAAQSLPRWFECAGAAVSWPSRCWIRCLALEPARRIGVRFTRR